MTFVLQIVHIKPENLTFSLKDLSIIIMTERKINVFTEVMVMKVGQCSPCDN